MKQILYSLFIFVLFFNCKSKNIVTENTSKIVKIEAVGESPVLIRQPYLQMVRSTTAIITWKTDSITEKCLVIFNELNSNRKKASDGFLTEHEGNKFNEVVIKNLKPETTYSYAIYSNGHLLASGKDYHFTTAPDNKSTEFSFYALGDIGAPPSWSFAKEPANRITELKTKPNFGLGLGDIVYPKGESKNYDNHLFKPFQEVFKNTPFYPVPGNHDWISDPEKNFDKEWSLPNNEHYYSFSYSNTLFIGLDSSNGSFYDKENQLKWLKETLKDNKDTYDWIVVYLHHNGKTCTYKPNYDHVISFYEVFANYKVDVVLNGHAHTYERLNPYDNKGNIDKLLANQSNYKNLKNRFISITLGAGGKLNKNWKADPNNSENCTDGTIVAHFEHVPSFGLFSIDKKSLTIKGINSLTGKEFDSFTIKK